LRRGSEGDVALGRRIGVNTRVAERRIDYTGRELRSGWLAEALGLEGDAIGAFRGSCMVSGPDLVDLEDLEAGNIVAGRDMLHFIVEMPGLCLAGITFAQRLLCSMVQEILNSAAGRDGRQDEGGAGVRVLRVERRGDDLFVGQGKLSVSVATVGPGSGLIHLALNVTTEGVPVRAACLEDLGIDPAWLAGEVLRRFAAEVESCQWAARKVRPVP
jgi:hypothetical protein